MSGHDENDSVAASEEGGQLKMAVNADVCIGAGQCEMLAEDTFYVDEDTVVARVTGTGLLPAELANRLVDSCPSGAISAAAEAEGAVGESPAVEDREEE